MQPLINSVNYPNSLTVLEKIEADTSPAGTPAVVFPLETVHAVNFNYLYSEGIIDIDGKLTPKFANISLPWLDQSFEDEVKKLLGLPIVSGSSSAPTLHSVLQYLLNSTNFSGKIEIIGGYLRKLILSQPTFIFSALERLGISHPEKIVIPPAPIPPDCDIRCTVLKISDDYTYRLSRGIYDLVKERMGDDFIEAEKITKKKFYHCDGNNQYGIITFRGNENLDFELMVIKELKRRSLFVHDSIRIVINSLVMGKTATILCVSDHGLQPIIDLLTGMVHIDKPEEVEQMGWPMLMSYYTRGYTSPQTLAENCMLQTSLPHHPYDLLQRCLKNHHVNNNSAAIALLFNSSVSLDSNFVIIKTLWDALPKKESHVKEDLLWAIKKLIKEEHVDFHVVVSCMQVLALLHLHSSDNSVKLVRHHQEYWIQIRIDDNYLLLPFQIEKALDDISLVNVEKIFLILLQAWTPKICVQRNSQIVKYGKMLQLNIGRLKEKILSNSVGLPIQAVLQSIESDPNFLLEICSKLPDFMESNRNNPVQTYFFSMLEQLFPIYSGTFSRAKEFSILEFRTRWMVALAETHEPSLCRLASSLFSQNQNAYNAHTRILLINNFLPQDPFSAMNVFDCLIDFDVSLFFKITHALKATPEGKIYLKTACREKIKSLIQANLPLSQQVLTHRSSPFFCDFELTKECFQKTISMDHEISFNRLEELLEIMLTICFIRTEFPDKPEIKLECCQLIISSLSKLQKDQILLTTSLIERLNNCSKKICEYLRGHDLPKDLYDFAALMQKLPIPFKNQQDLIWSLRELLKQEEDIQFILKGIKLVKNVPEDTKGDLALLIKEIRNSLKGDPLTSAEFFLNDVPEIYGEGFSEEFQDQAYAISRNISKKEASLKLSVQLLKKYKISKPEIWNKVFLKAYTSKDKEIRLLTLPLIFEFGEYCEGVCWTKTLETAYLHKNQIIYDLIDKLLDENSNERKVFLNAPSSLQEKGEILAVLLRIVLERFPKKTESMVFGYRIFKLHELLSTITKKPPEIELDLLIIEAILSVANLDGLFLIFMIVVKRSDEIQDLSSKGKLIDLTIKAVKSMKSRSKEYEDIRTNFQRGLDSCDNEAMLFYNYLQGFLTKIQHYSTDCQNKEKTWELFKEAMPLFIDFGSYSDTCFSYKLLNSEEFKSRTKTKDYNAFWERYIETRLTLSFSPVKRILHGDVLQFFALIHCRLNNKSVVKNTCMNLAIIHYIEFLKKEYNPAQDLDLMRKLLYIFGCEDTHNVTLITQLISCDPNTVELSELICSTISEILLTLKAQKRISDANVSKIFNDFIFMELFSPKVDEATLRKKVSTLLESCLQNKYFLDERIMKWIICYELEEKFLTKKLINPKFVKQYKIPATIHLLVDCLSINRLQGAVDILKNIQKLLIQQDRQQLKICYQYFIDLFKLNRNLFFRKDDITKEIDVAILVSKDLC